MKNLLLALLLGPILLFAQDSVFTPISSLGAVPADFLLLSSEKYQADIEDLDYKNHKEKDFKESILLNVNFQLDRLLTSGRVLYNDPVSNYVSYILDYLLEDNPELRNELRVYTLKTPEANALATDQGMVFVSVGLLAQVENEAQLAFILAHELSHYVNQHVMNENLTEFNVSKKSGTHGSSDFSKTMAKSRYSRELELTADADGLDLYLKTDYSLDELNSVFDVLLYSYLPIDEVAYDYSRIFERGDFYLPSEFVLKPEDTQVITAEEDYDDSQSTHPNIAKRRKAIGDEIDGMSNEGRHKFMVSEKDFYYVQNMARKQMLHEYMIEGKFGEAIVNASILLENDSSDIYAQKIVADAMYAIGRFTASGNQNDALTNDRKVEGYSQSFFYTMDEIDKEAVLTHALRVCYEFFEKSQDSSYYYRTVELASDLSYEYDVRYDDFYDFVKDTNAVDAAAVEVESKRKSKYAKIKTKRKSRAKSSKQTNDEYYLHALYDIIDSDLMVEIFEEADEFTEYRREERDKEVDRKAEKREEKSKIKYGEAHGIDKLLVLTPEYYIIDERKGEANRYLAAEEKYDRWVQGITGLGSKANLDVEVLDPHFITSEDEQKFNDVVFLNDWIRERYLYSGNTNRLYQSAYTDSLIERYNTRYVAITGVMNYLEKRPNKAAVLILSAVSVIYFPYGVYYALTNNRYMSYYMIVFDLKTGKAIMVQNEEMKLMNRLDVLNHMMYDSFYQLSQDSNGHE